MIALLIFILELAISVGAVVALLFFGPTFEAGCAGSLAIAVISALILYALSRPKMRERLSGGPGRFLAAVDRVIAFLMLAAGLFFAAFCAYLLIRGH